MASTYSSLHCHIIFSTKNRAPIIADDFRDRLHAYIGGAIRGMGGKAVEIGGVADHIHILAGLRPSHSLANIVREIKKESNAWARQFNQEFVWQEGYAAFAVSASHVPAVQAYIRNQHEHHRKLTFMEELKMLLDEAAVSYEERYLE
jgi:putative transposase